MNVVCDAVRCAATVKLEILVMLVNEFVLSTQIVVQNSRAN